MKKLLISAIFVTAMILCVTGCADDVSPNGGTGGVTSSPETQAPDILPVPNKPEPEQGIVLREVPIYGAVELSENGWISVLDITEDSVLFAVNREQAPEGEQGAETETVTEYIAVYDMNTGSVGAVTETENVHVWHGVIVDGDYVYSAVDFGWGLERGGGYVRRVGEHPWEYRLTGVIEDGGTVPMPRCVSDDGSILFVECRGLYYEPRGEGEMSMTLSEYVGVVSVAEDGTAEVIFEPTERGNGSSQLVPYGDGYAFSYRAESGANEIYSVGADGVSLLYSAAEFRSVFPWMAETDGGLLMTVGYGNNTEGNTEIRNAFLTAGGELVEMNKKAYMRLVSDGEGNIAAVNMDWGQYLLTYSNGEISFERLDLPACPTEFYRSSDGRLYAHLYWMQPVGLYEIVK